MLKLHEPFKEQEFFINSLNSSDLGFESKYFSELFGWYFTPWICIYLWIRKSCGSNGSRSLGLVLRDFFMVLVHILPLGSGPRSRKPKNADPTDPDPPDCCKRVSYRNIVIPKNWRSMVWIRPQHLEVKNMFLHLSRNNFSSKRKIYIF